MLEKQIKTVVLEKQMKIFLLNCMRGSFISSKGFKKITTKICTIITLYCTTRQTNKDAELSSAFIKSFPTWFSRLWLDCSNKSFAF